MDAAMNLPTPGQSVIDRKVVTKVHEDFEAQYHELRFGRENYEGSGGYAPYLDDITIADTQPDDEQTGTIDIDTSRRTHLFRHPRERAKFERRVAMAYLTNVIKKSVNMIGGFLTKKQPTYDDYPQAIKDWMSKVNHQGDTWEDFKCFEIVLPVLYYGWLPTIFYRKQVDAETVAQQKAAGGDLVVEVINPENIVDWRAGENGFEWLKVKTKVDKTGPLDEKARKVDRYTWYTPHGWWYVDDEDSKATQLAVVEAGPWANGMPIVVWSLRGGALTHDANAVQRELYNVNSLVQEQERNTTFSMLSAPDGGSTAGKRVQQIGSDTVFWFDPQSKHRPDWMAPPPQVLEHLMKKLVHLTEEILSTVGLDFDSGGGATGMAFQFKMSKIVRLLQITADSFGRAESRCLVRVGLEEHAPVDDKVRCVWPSEFDAKDVEKLIDGLERVLDRVKSETARVEAMVKIASAGLGDMDEELRTKIRKQCEEAVKQDDLDADNNPDDLRAQAELARRMAEGGVEETDDLAADGGAR